MASWGERVCNSLTQIIMAQLFSESSLVVNYFDHTSLVSFGWSAFHLLPFSPVGDNQDAQAARGHDELNSHQRLMVWHILIPFILHLSAHINILRITSSASTFYTLDITFQNSRMLPTHSNRFHTSTEALLTNITQLIFNQTTGLW